jgi:nicotinamidase/pyrazinamidase
MCYLADCPGKRFERRFRAVASQTAIILWCVDTQIDFMIPGGHLYVPGAEKLIPNIKRLVDSARDGDALLISSGCQHTENDPEFKIFPPHCVRGTKGAELIPESQTNHLIRIPNDPEFALPADLLAYKQILIDKQTLDVFENRHTAKIVESLPPAAEFFVFGVVTEFCVRCAGKGLLLRGRGVSIVHDAIETLDPDVGKKTIDELASTGAQLISTDQAIARLQQTRTAA